MSESRQRKRGTQFVFLEFLDPAIRDFLMELRDALNGKKETSPIHITVRGPYANPPDPSHIDELREKLFGLGVYIGGAGIFPTDDSFAVYLKAQSPVFDEIWWKPDYPKETHKTNPHVTIFETKDKRAAVEVEKFLKKERIEIHTFGIDLKVRSRKQIELFEPHIDYLPGKLPTFLEKLKVKPGFLSRAKALGDSLPKNVDT